MAIKGNLREAGLPDVLQLLAMGQKTGCLSLADRSNFGYIYFDRGRITYASIVNRRDRLGDLLVKNGLLDPRDLAGAIDEQARDPSSRLGEILIRRGAITREQLEQYIRIQIEEAVSRAPRGATSGVRTSGIGTSPLAAIRSREKVVWRWPEPGERLIEEL